MNEMDDLEELDDPVAGLLGAVLVRRLRLRYGLQGAAERTGLSSRILQRYEKGEAAPPSKTLALLGRQAGYTGHLLDHLRSSLAAYRLAEAGGLAGEPASSGRPLAEEVIAAALAAVETADALFVAEPAPAAWEETGQPRPEDRQRADELWRRFMSLARDRRYRLVRDSSAFRLWSFAERLAHESNAAASDSPAEALDIARLALEVARDVRGTPSWRARVEVYVLSHLGNAHRVCNSLDQARAGFERARKLQGNFAPGDPPLLDESRLSDLEASLRREERRFPEALVLLEECLGLCPAGRRGRILLKKATTLEQMGAYERALETLREAEPHVLATGIPRDLWCLRFSTAVCKCHLGLAGEAEDLLPEIQGLADRLGKGLDRLRTRWLTARVAAGLGRTEEAVAVLDRVCDDFLRGTPPLPIDAALAGLDLALYWLEQGNTAAVKKLAVPLERLFAVQGIRREVLSALRLFCEAARREAATLEMVNKAKAELARRG